MPTAKAKPKKAQDTRAKAPRDERSGIERSTELTRQVLKELESGQRSAIGAVRRFVDSTDNALPSLSSGPSRPQEIIDSALEMSERLVQTQYEFLRNVVQGTGRTLGGSNRTE